jgi:hypothetical protein
MITRTVRPTISDCEITGFLYEADCPQCLGEDMMDVVLPNGILITAGWYPEGSPRGTYRICVYRGHDELIPPIASRDIDQIACDLEMLASTYRDRDFRAVSDAESHRTAIVVQSWDALPYQMSH